MKFQLQRTQQINTDIDEAWHFFSSPHNLSKMTPKDMGFVVLTNFDTEVIYEGMKIDYKVSPLFGIGMKWKTRIAEVQPKKSFTDFQEKGPFKSWNHCHQFIPNEKGVLMKDVLDYEMPYGVLGKWVHSLIVKKKLESIFAYRYQMLEELFNKKS